MLDSIPVPFQAILWPLAGAALILALGRLLPNWVRRLLAVAVCLASFAALWSLKGGDVARVQIAWEPLNLFRMSPTLYADGLALLCGMILACITAAMVLGIRGGVAQKTMWHGWMLVALAGGTTAMMAANLMALALGSALLDLALLAILVSTASETEPSRRMPLSLAVPGVASTLILLFSALQMDAQVGHASLLSRNLAEGTLVLVGVAGVLRFLLFPLHPRELSMPESAATWLLPVGVGGYLLARVQALVPVLNSQSWLMALAILAALAGGLLAWSHDPSSGIGAERRQRNQDQGSGLGAFWPGALVHQTAYVLGFLLLLPGVMPWPVLSLMLSLAGLVIWWDGSREIEAAPRSRWVEWITRQVRSWWAKARSYAAMRFLRAGRGEAEEPRVSRLGQYGKALVPGIALLSLAGAPFTVGARARWPYYAAWLERGESSLLIVLAADALLYAGLWIALGTAVEQAGKRRHSPSALVAALALSLLVVLLGIAPGIAGDALSLRATEPPSVSVWGLGLLYILPWLLGAWLARMKSRLRGYFDRVQHIVSLDWLHPALDWVGQRLLGVLFWFGQVGEGEGWWGWALIVLALGVVLLAAR